MGPVRRRAAGSDWCRTPQGQSGRAVHHLEPVDNLFLDAAGILPLLELVPRSRTGNLAREQRYETMRAREAMDQRPIVLWYQQ